MGRMLFWMVKPDPGIPDNSWTGYLDLMTVVTILIVLTTVIAAMFCYTSAARRRKIYVLDDLFTSYTPMYWIFLAIPAALLGFGLCFWQYGNALDTIEGRWAVALQISLVNAFLSASISYLVIIFVRQLTPAKFRYRPAPFLAKRNAGGS